MSGDRIVDDCPGHELVDDSEQDTVTIPSHYGTPEEFFADVGIDRPERVTGTIHGRRNGSQEVVSIPHSEIDWERVSALIVQAQAASHHVNRPKASSSIGRSSGSRRLTDVLKTVRERIGM